MSDQDLVVIENWREPLQMGRGVGQFYTCHYASLSY